MTKKQALEILKEQNKALETTIASLENEYRFYKMKVKYILPSPFEDEYKETVVEGLVCGQSFEEAMETVINDYYYDDNIISISLEQCVEGRIIEMEEVKRC